MKKILSLLLILCLLFLCFCDYNKPETKIEYITDAPQQSTPASSSRPVETSRHTKIVYDKPDRAYLIRDNRPILAGEPSVSPSDSYIAEPDTDSANSQPQVTPTLTDDGMLQTEAGKNIDYMKGITAADSQGNDLKSRVSWKTNADFQTAGNYVIFYTVSDTLGNKSVLRRILKVCQPGTLFLYNREKAEAIVDASAEKYNTMGVSVAVIENGQVVDTIAKGYAVKNTEKMTPNTKIRIASISKIGVALAAAKLYDEGIIDPDTDISEYWGAKIRNPNYPDIPVTIRDIMCHTSSMTSNDTDYLLSIKGTLNQLLSGEVFVHCKPGASTSFMYNNYAFGIFADTLELSSGEVLDDYLKKNIFTPLGIDASYSTATLKKEDLAELYDAEWNVTRSVDLMSTRPVRTELGGYIWYYAGNLTISAGDFARLAAVLINGGVYGDMRILSSKAVRLLEEPQFTARDEVPMEFTQCLPLRYRSGMYGRKNLYYHTGHAYGMCAIMCFDPDSGDGIVVLTTGAYTGIDDYGVTDVCSDIAAPILDMLSK